MDFYELLTKYYDRLFPAGEQQINFLVKHLGSGRYLVDVACGSGNYAVALASRGYSILGIELDDHMYKLAQAKQAQNCKFVQGNMLDLQGLVSAGPDGIYCIGNSIVHLQSTEQVESVFRQVYTLLRPAGTFVLQVVNYDRWLAGAWQGFKDINLPDGVVFKRQYSQDGEYIRFEAIISDEFGTHRSSTRLMPISSEQFLNLGQRVGFIDSRLYGGFDSSQFSLNSPALVMVMKKG